MSNETAVTVREGFQVAKITEDFKKELKGITLEIPQLKMPAAGGLFFEIDDEPHKELQGVIISHGPKNVYFASEFDGSNLPPDCSSNEKILRLAKLRIFLRNVKLVSLMNLALAKTAVKHVKKSISYISCCLVRFFRCLFCCQYLRVRI